MVLIIRRIISLFTAFLLLGQCRAYGDDFAGNLSAQAAALMWNGEMIYAKNAGQKLPVASTTKLMTALVTAESCALSEQVEIEASDCNVEGSSMYLSEGETLTVKELLKGLLLVSGNDAALALARHAGGGSVESFVAMMNEKASELSMTSSHFTNPHGLSDREHYSTAADMALLMTACLANTDVREIMSLKSCDVGGKTFANHNRLLFSLKGCTGGKTGYTEAAGRCLVSSCRRDGAELVCVTLNAPDDWNDHIALYNTAFARYSLRNVSDGMRFSVPVIGGSENTAYLVPEGKKEIFADRKSEVTVTAKLPWYLFAPLNKGETEGTALISVDGKYAWEYPLVCMDGIEAKNS